MLDIFLLTDYDSGSRISNKLSRLNYDLMWHCVAGIKRHVVYVVTNIDLQIINGSRISEIKIW